MTTLQSQDQKLLDILDAVYEAGCDTAVWQRVADLCRDLVPGAAFSQLVAMPGRFQSPIPIASGWPADFLQSYSEYYYTINPYPALLAPVPPGTVILAGDVVNPRWQREQAFFNEWAKPAGNFTGGASLALHRSPESYTRLTFDIPEKYRRYEAWAGEILRRIGPHVRRALELNARLDAAALDRGVSDALLDMLEETALVVDALGRIRAQNGKADTLLRSGRIMSATGGRLAFLSVRADQAFRAALHACVSIVESTMPSAFATEPGNPPPARALVLPLRIKRATAVKASAERLALVLIDDGRQKKMRVAEGVLRSLYGLTPAELRVTLAIVGGGSLEEAADRHNISRATARNQLAAVMRKLGVRRQSELVAFVAGLAPRLGSGP